MADKYRVDKDGIIAVPAWRTFTANGYYVTYLETDYNSPYDGSTIPYCTDYPGGAFLSPAVYKDPEGRVHLRGLIGPYDPVYIQHTIGTYLFLLPSDCRPNRQIIVPVRGNTGSCRMDITATGYGFIQEAPAYGWQSFVCLDGISFDTRA
jgi:hypothetical protein